MRRPARRLLPLLAVLSTASLAATLGACGKDRAQDRAPAAEAEEEAPASAKAADEAAEKKATPAALARLRVLAARPTPTATFERFGVNPTIAVAAEPVSVFAADPDAASWALARGWLARGALPPEAGIRTEEVANAFDYGYPDPQERALSVVVDAAPSPLRPGYHALRIGLKGAARGKHAEHVVLVVSVSDRGAAAARLKLAREAAELLLESLDEPTHVSLVTAAPGARVLVAPTELEAREPLVAGLREIEAGPPALAEALGLAYQRAAEADEDGPPAAVVLVTDSARDGGADPRILEAARRFAGRGGRLVVGGLGVDGYDDPFLRRLAAAGGGRYHYLDRGFEAQRLVEGLFAPMARRLTLALTFDPARVQRYRLVGWESRLVSAQPGAADATAGGTLRAREELTALWEVKLAEGGPPGAPLATLSLRFLAPGDRVRRGFVRPITDADVAPSWEDAAGTLRLAVVASAFAEKLRGAYWVRGLTWDALGALAAQTPSRPGVRELREAIAAAGRLDRRGDRFATLGPGADRGWDELPTGSP